MNNPQKIFTFFTAKLPGCEFSRMDIYSIELIEKMADMPPTTLFKFLKGYKDRGIKKHIGKLVPVLEMLGYKRAVRGESLIWAVLEEVKKIEDTNKKTL